MPKSESEVLDRLYAAPFDPEAMPEALRAIGALIGAQSLNVRLLDMRTREPVIVAVDGPYHTDPATMASYFGHWIHFDAHVTAAMNASGRILADEELISAEQAAQDPFINEFYIPTGCGPIVGWFDRKNDVATAFGAIRDQGRAAYGPESKRVLARIKPHVDRTLRLVASAARTGLSHGDLAHLHTLEGLAFLRCSGDGRVLVASPGAEATISGSGAVRLSRSRLIWRDPEDERRFVRLCRAAADRSSGAEFGFVTRDGERAWLRIAAAPAPAGDAVLIRMRRLQPAAALSPALLQSLFGLSAGEARVAIAVAEGAGLPELAARFEVAHATVKTQLRGAFEKTGTRRQSELAALITRLA